jgi:hypothetical protein
MLCYPISVRGRDEARRNPDKIERIVWDWSNEERPTVFLAGGGQTRLEGSAPHVEDRRALGDPLADVISRGLAHNVHLPLDKKTSMNDGKTKAKINTEKPQTRVRK